MAREGFGEHLLHRQYSLPLNDMRNVPKKHLSDDVSPLLCAPSGIGQTEQIEAVSDAPSHSEPKENKFDRTPRERHFDLHQDELTGTLSEYEIDAARRRGWM